MPYSRSTKRNYGDNPMKKKSRKKKSSKKRSAKKSRK